MKLFSEIYVLLLAALFGAAMGSFINCICARLVKGQSALRGRSACPSCAHTLGSLDLIPVFSYLFLRGRCRYCGARIPKRCLYTELLGAALCLSLLLRYGLALQTAAYAALLFILMAAALCDLDTGLVYDRFILAGIGCFVLFALVQPAPVQTLLRGLLGGAVCSVPLLLLVLAADRLMGRETMGGGDIKLFFMAGLYFSWQCGLLFIIFSCILGILFALLAKKGRGVEFPFAPAIAAGAWLSVLAAQPLLNWYIGLFI